MKNVLLTICLVAILLIAGCNSEVSSEKNFRVWVASNESTTLRGGYLVDPNTEIGGEFSCQDDELRTMGIYVIRLRQMVLSKFQIQFRLLAGLKFLKVILIMG